MSNHPARLLTESKKDFKQLAKYAGSVVRECRHSERAEAHLIKALEKFVRLTVLALRAARELRSDAPSDEFVKDYLCEKLVGEVFDKVVKDLDSETPSAASSDAD